MARITNKTRADKANSSSEADHHCAQVCSAADQDLLCYPNTDTGNGERLIHRFGDQIRFCPEMRKWLIWDRKRWLPDNFGKVRRLAKITVRVFYAQAATLDDKAERTGAEKFARHSENAASLRAVLECAQCEEAIVVSARDLDSDPWLLNCLDGTIDLRTGELRQHDPKDLIIKLCPVRFDPNGRCELFKQFLRRIMGGSEELIAYVQRALGYAITGLVSEKALFLFVGDGDNGKTTLLELVRFIVGDYGAQVLIDTLMLKHENNASLSDLADLRGARFVTTSETEEGQRLWEGKLKYLTGMNEIKSCRKYENHVTFAPTHTLFVDANHRPVVRGTDRAIWNRLKLVPFTVTIPVGERDKNLREKLKVEAPGILAWLVQGCLEWQRLGLNDPDAVRNAHLDWRDESEPLRDFIGDCCELRSDASCTAHDLRDAYEFWATENDVDRLIPKQFAARLKNLGCTPARDKRTRRWMGIGLRPSGEMTGDA